MAPRYTDRCGTCSALAAALAQARGKRRRGIEEGVLKAIRRHVSTDHGYQPDRPRVRR